MKMNEPRFTHRYDNGVLHIKLLVWKWRIYLMIGPRAGEVGLENPSVVSTQLPGQPLDVGTTTTTNDWGYGK